MIKNNNKKDLSAEVYRDRQRFHTIAMITDINANSGGNIGGNAQKHEGALFIAPVLRLAAKIKLKNIELVFAGVNTSKSQDAITALTGYNNRKYTEELGELFDNLENKLTNLKSDKYKDEDKKYVLDYLRSIRDKIGTDNDKIASGIYQANDKGVDLPGTIERGSQGKCKCWAMAFDGLKDFDREDLIIDDKINPVHTFYGMTNTNGADLKSLIGVNRFQIFNTSLKTKLGDKDFSKGLKLDDKPGYYFFLSYFIQGLLQVVAMDNRNNLLGVDFAFIANNWNKFLDELLDPNRKDIFNNYEPDGEEKYDCPINFTKFLLDKLLGAELLKKLQIDNYEMYKMYANGAATISSLLANADFANQLVAMEFDDTLKDLTHDNSLFIAQDDFVFALLYNLHKDLDNDIKNKLKLLAYGLKDKEIQLDQTSTTTSTEYKFGRMQELERDKSGNVASIKYKVSNFYDTDISAEELMGLVLKIRDLKQTIPRQIYNVVNKFGNNNGNNGNNVNKENSVDSVESFLDALIEAKRIDGLNRYNIQRIVNNQRLMDAVLKFVKDKNCDKVYRSIYAWFINKPEVMEEIKAKYLIPELISVDNVSCFFGQQYGLEEDELAGVLLSFSKSNTFNKNLASKITQTVIDKMFVQDQDETNRIITKFVCEFNSQQIRETNLSNEKLYNSTINEVFFRRHLNLTDKQIASIDCSKLNDVCITIFFNKHLKAISQYNVDTLSDDALKKLAPRQIVKLINIKQDNKRLNFSKHQDWLKSLSFDYLIKDLKNQNNREAFVDFVAAHIDSFSETQILSLSKYVLTQCKRNKDYANKVEQILNKIDEKVGDSPVYKAFVGIKSIDIKKDEIYFRKFWAILILIHQSDPEILGQLFQYFIDTNKFSYLHLDSLFSIIANCDVGETLGIDKDEYDYPTVFKICKDINAKLNTDKEINNLKENNMGNFLNICQDIYKTIKNKNPNSKDFSEPSLESIKKSMSEIKSVLNDTLKQSVKLDENKDKNKIKLINKLDLKNLPRMLNSLMSSGELSNLLSDMQINQIDLSKLDLALANVKVLFEKFGDKLSFMQLQNLVSCFNSLNANCQKKIDEKTVRSLDFMCFYILSKIIAANNIVNGKEKEFGDKYKQLGDNLEDIIYKFNNDCILKIAVTKYVEDNQQQGQYCLAHGYNSAADKVVVDDGNKKNENLKLDLETLNELGNSIDEFTKQVDTAILNKSDLSSLEEKAEQIKDSIKKFNQEYQRCKSKFFGKFKANFSAAVGSLDMKKFRECLNAVYDWNKKTKAERDKELEDENYNENDFMELVNLDNKDVQFKKYFIDDFIKLKLDKTKDDNFSETQKRNLGIINVVDDIQTQAQSGENILVQYTPGYISNNMPLILENCHCNERDLAKIMREFGLDNWILKFDKNTNKKKESPESFIDDKKLVLIDHDNCYYFKAVKKLFWDHADNIWENADLEFERKNDDKNKSGQSTSNGSKSNGKFSMNKAKTIQTELHSGLKYCTQKMGTFKSPKGKIGKQIVGCFDKKDIIDKLNSMDYRKFERFMFFCGDWICVSKKFRDQKNFLDEFINIVIGRIDFGCRDISGRYNQHEVNNEKSIIPEDIANDVCSLSDEAYNLLTAYTLLSGLNQSIKNEGKRSRDAKKEEIIKITQDFIPRICQLITGKDRNFSEEDMDLIFQCCTPMEMEKDNKKLSPVAFAVANYIISCQNDRETIKSVIKNLKRKEASCEDQICLLEYIANNSEKVELIEVIQAIAENNFYPDHGASSYSYSSEELSFKFIERLTRQLLSKYNFGIYPHTQQKEALKKFFEAFMVSNDVFKNHGAEVANFFKKLIEKVSHDKLKDVTKEIINICTGLKWPNQRAAILRYILEASNDSIQGLDLLKVLKEYDYTRRLLKGANIEPEFTQLDSNLVEKIISDVLKNPSKLTQEEVEQLEYFCTTCVNINGADKNKTDEYLSLFSQLIQKIPSGSMSRNMFSGLICNIFPNLLENPDESKDIETLQLNKFDIKTAKALAYALSESEYVLKDYMPDPSYKERSRDDRYKGNKTYSFEPEDFFNSLSSDDLKNKNIRALVYSVYRDFNLSKVYVSNCIEYDNEKDTLENYDSIFYDLISKFPYNAIGEDELKQLFSISVMEPENLRFKDEWVEGVCLINRWYSIDCKKLLKTLAVVESDSIDKFTTLIGKMKSKQSSVSVNEFYNVRMGKKDNVDWSAVNHKNATIAKKQANFEIAGRNLEFDDFLHLINCSKLAQGLVKIAYNKEEIPKLNDFYSNLYEKYFEYAGRIETLREEMAKLPLLASRDFGITDDFYSNLYSFFSSVVLSKNYKNLYGSCSSVLSYYLLRVYFLFSEGGSIQDKFNKLNLSEDKVKLTEDGSLEILLGVGKMIFQGFSEVALAKEKLILISRSKSFISKDFIRSIKLLNEQEKEKKSLCLGIKYEDQNNYVHIQQILFSFGEDDDVEAKLKNREQLIDYVINNFEDLFLEGEKDGDNFDIAMSFLFELDRDWLSKFNININAFDKAYSEQLSRLINKLSDLISSDINSVMLNKIVGKLGDLKTHAIKYRFALPDNFDELIQGLTDKRLRSCISIKKKKQDQDKEKLRQKKIEQRQEKERIEREEQEKQEQEEKQGKSDNKDKNINNNSKKENMTPLDALKLQLTDIENKLNSPKNNNNNQTPEVLLKELSDALGETWDKVKDKNEKKIIDKDTFARITNILDSIQKQFKNNNDKKDGISQTIEGIYGCLVDKLVQNQSLDIDSFLEFLGISNKLGKVFDLQDFISYNEKQILSGEKSKEDLQKILKFIPKSSMLLQDISHINAFLNNIGTIVVPQGKKESAIVNSTELCGMLAECGVFEYCFKYYLIYGDIENLENDNNDNVVESWVSGISGAIKKACAADNLNEEQTNQIKEQILGEFGKAAQAADVIQLVNETDDNERQRKLKRIQGLLNLDLEQGKNKEQDKLSENNKNEEKEKENENNKEKEDEINKNKYNNNLEQKFLDGDLNQYQNSDNKVPETGELIQINSKNVPKQPTEQKQPNNYTPKPAGIYAILALISIFFPPVFGIGLFILKIQDPKHKITIQDIVLLVPYSLPIVAPIAGFRMVYKASQENQEIKAQNLSNEGSKNNKNNDEKTIVDKIDSLNQNQQVKNIDNEKIKERQSIVDNEGEK